MRTPKLRAYTAMVDARRWARGVAMILLLALTSRASSALLCILPCGASPAGSAAAQTATVHCGASHSTEGISGEAACPMADGDTERAAVRSADRLPLVPATAHVFPPYLSAARTSAGRFAAAASLLAATHAPPGKPLPLRV